MPCTILYPSHPYSDILAWDLLRPNDTNTGLLLAIPAPDDCTIPGYAVEQVGDWVSVAMLKPHKWIGTPYDPSSLPLRRWELCRGER